MFKNILTFCLLFFVGINSFALSGKGNGGGSVTVPAGTAVFVEMIDPVSSKTHRTGDTVSCKVKYDVKVNEQVIITAGTSAACRVKHCLKSRICGKPGEIQLEPLYTSSIDGKAISLSGELLKTTGASKRALSLLIGWGGCLPTGGLTLFALLIKGEQATIASGAAYETKTIGEYVIGTNNSSGTANSNSTPANGNSQMRGGSDPFKGTNVANANKDIKVGKYYALIIGIDNYSGTWTPLKNAVSDAKAIEGLLKLEYRIDVFKTLYNTQASRANIINELEWLVNNVKENDNVLIYYSGHGEFKKEMNKGFWVPSDANSNAMSQFVSNNDIQTFLSGINSKHTLLISDACFSGDIFRGTTSSIPFENSEKYYFNVYNSKSRQAISSGGIEPVMDGGKNGHSVFAYYLLQALQTNDAKYYDAGQLFNKLKIPVVNNSDQSPNFNPIKNSGDEGGQFLFIKK